MNVVYASNENYVRHMAASMVSLFAKNRKVPKLCVYVLSMGITGESRKRLEEMANGYKRRIRWVELRDIRERLTLAWIPGALTSAPWGGCLWEAFCRSM